MPNTCRNQIYWGIISNVHFNYLKALVAKNNRDRSCCLWKDMKLKSNTHMRNNRNCWTRKKNEYLENNNEFYDNVYENTCLILEEVVPKSIYYCWYLRSRPFLLYITMFNNVLIQIKLAKMKTANHFFFIRQTYDIDQQCTWMMV